MRCSSVVSPEYKQHAEEPLNLLVLSMRLSTPNLCERPMGKHSNGMKSGYPGDHRSRPSCPRDAITNRSRTGAQFDRALP
ncbi:hypothetical protein TNCV_3087851 [Trichonephila clavipes]|uniref:Uncharacterized protein n=1 Tax=Trichonephila clavipes TaxID=2585209 RepID=A0A8X6RFZ9_TRICX|nr:hypothetical protein TNCV_3087851 [Trichonephila clavipes]